MHCHCFEGIHPLYTVWSLLFPLDTVILFCSLLEVIVLCSTNLSTLSHHQRAVLETCSLRLDTWDTDFISDNWEQQYQHLHRDPWIKSDGDSIRNCETQPQASICWVALSSLFGCLSSRIGNMNIYANIYWFWALVPNQTRPYHLGIAWSPEFRTVYFV